MFFKLASKTEQYDDELSSVNNTPRIDQNQFINLEDNLTTVIKTKNECLDEVLFQLLIFTQVRKTIEFVYF